MGGGHIGVFSLISLILIYFVDHLSLSHPAAKFYHSGSKKKKKTKKNCDMKAKL